jgi:transketolase
VDPYATSCPAEKSGQEEFDFEFGDEFGKHIEAFHPTFCKVLVRYNPEGDKALNVVQSSRLRRLSDYLHCEGRSLFTFELLVPPLKAQLERVQGDKYGWNVLRLGDTNDIDRIDHALQVSAVAHGEPLGEEQVRLTKRYYGWPEDVRFLGVGARGAEARCAWTALFDAYRAKYAELATEIDQIQRRELPSGWDRNLPAFPADSKGIAGREASGKVLNVLAQNIPWFLGGSADLGPSNKTILAGAGDFQANSPGGRNLHFGIREHAMAAIVNGLALSKLRAYGASFFIFSDYARPAMRHSALMELPAIYIFTHDAMGDGEDGPTHQPVEHLASLRAIPGLVILRPGDANEVVEAYRYLIRLRHEPAVLVLSRQPLPTLDRSQYAPASGVAHGAYVLADTPGGNPEIAGEGVMHASR